MHRQPSFSNFFVEYWSRFESQVGVNVDVPIAIDGRSLDVASVVASARHGKPVFVSESAVAGIEAGTTVIKDSLANGTVIYGVNTGFGGSADSRTSAMEALQATLIRELHYGILPSVTRLRPSQTDSDDPCTRREHHLLDTLETASPMPESWARASMLVRLNSLSSGASGVRLVTVRSLASLLSKDIVPQIPLRGSISASGDLSPLAYIAGAVSGKRSIRVWAGSRDRYGQRKTTSADSALREADITPVVFGPKEGLALVNGTAVSAGVAALALHEIHAQAALSHVLTAMTVEALMGTDDSFDPFIAKVRPHPGQWDSANTIYAFLSKSKLVFRNDGKEDMTLRQDRYSIRTAPQWIGPMLEDLLLAHSQVATELNSVTDNPLIDTSTGNILHGGNFQAKSVTSAVEKARLGIQTIGRMLFSQCGELINPVTSRGLPANLVVEEPWECFIWKGTDIYIAALASELGFLANPVGTHVMTAEMGNQSLNSLALISTRYTLTALDVLTQLSALHLMALCQALDNRALHHLYHYKLRQALDNMVEKLFQAICADGSEANGISNAQSSSEAMWRELLRRFEQTMTMDSGPRITKAVQSLWPTLMQLVPESAKHVHLIQTFVDDLASAAIDLFSESKDEYRARPDATPLLGDAARRLYRFVRHELRVPFLGRAQIATPPPERSSADGGEDHDPLQDMPPTVGTFLTRIYESMRSGSLCSEVLLCFREVQSRTKKTNGNSSSSGTELVE